MDSTKLSHLFRFGLACVGLATVGAQASAQAHPIVPESATDSAALARAIGAHLATDTTLRIAPRFRCLLTDATCGPIEGRPGRWSAEEPFLALVIQHATGSNQPPPGGVLACPWLSTPPEFGRRGFHVTLRRPVIADSEASVYVSFSCRNSSSGPAIAFVRDVLLRFTRTTGGWRFSEVLLQRIT